MSPNLRGYLLTWYTLGAASLAYAIFCAIQYTSSDAWRGIVWCIAASVLLNIKTVRGTSKAQTDCATVSLSSAAAFVAILSISPVAGTFVEAFSTVVDSCFPKRRPLYQALFNISVCSVGALSAGLVYHALGGPSFPFGHRTEISSIATASGPMLVASIVYFIINTVAVAEVVALASDSSVTDVWRRMFKNSFVGYTAGASCAVIVTGLSSHMHVIWLLTLCLPVLYACYSREQSDEARVVALERGKERLEGMYISTVRTLALTVAARDRYTSGHIHRVASYALAVARDLGCTGEELTDLETGALLHDVGKIGVPEHILTKPGRLTADEMDQMRRHAEIGWAILEPLDYPDVVKKIVRHHHEKVDGTGYPDGLRGEEMPLMVRIVSVCDVFDALTSDRPYRTALSVDAAREIMREMEGKHFDPVILQAFFHVLDSVPWEELRALPSDSPVLTDLLSDRTRPAAVLSGYDASTAARCPAPQALPAREPAPLR